jgi:putative hydrolase of the HAD superfamily
VGFEKLIESLGVPICEMAYVGDNEKKDFIAPNRLGLLTIQVLRPARLHLAVAEVPDAEAKVKIDDIRMLPRVFADA